MTELDSQVNQGQPNFLVRSQKLHVLAILAIVLIISHLPWWVGRLVLIDEGMSKNDLLLFLILPSFHYLLMFICPIFAARIKPKLAGFDITWIRKKRSEIGWIFLLPLMALISSAIIRCLMKQLDIPLTKITMYESLLYTNAIFLIAVIFLVAFIIPIVEEIFWRGFIQDRMGKVIGPRIALFTQAIAFALLHFRPIGGFFEVFVYGLIFGLWRHKRKTLLPIIIAHVIINSLYCIGRYDWADLTKINIKTDYVAQFKEISRPVNYDLNDNAAPYYKKAFELSVRLPEQLSKSDRKAWPKDLPDEKQILLQNWASANSEALEQLKLGTQKSYYWPKYQGSSMWDIVLPADLAKARNLMYALCWRAKLDATKNKFKTAFSDLLVCYQFGKHLMTGPKTLIGQLVGIAISDDVAQTGLQILDKTKLDPHLLKSFQQEYQALSSKETFVIDFTAEKFCAYDSIQMTFTDDGKGGGYIRKAELRQIKNMLENSKEQMRSLKQPDRRQTTELVDKVFEYFNSARHKTPAQSHSEGKDLEKIIDEMTKNNPFLRMLMPAAGRCIEISFRGKDKTDALITTVAILRHKAEKGEYPANLRELLTTGYLNELPIDPYSDGPLVYKRIGDDFILYSLGADFDDDGGTPSKWGEGKEGGDQVFWPVERPK